MALLADAIPLGGSELPWVHHRLAGFDMIAARPMAPFASQAAFRKGRRRIPVLRARDVLNPGGVTLQTSRQDGPGKIRVVDSGKAGRGFPRNRAAVIGDGRLIEK